MAAPKALLKAGSKVGPKPLLKAVPEPAPAGVGPMDLPAGAFLKVPQAAALVNVHKFTLYREIREGSLPAFSLGANGRMVRVKVADLRAWVGPYVATGGGHDA